MNVGKQQQQQHKKIIFQVEKTLYKHQAGITALAVHPSGLTIDMISVFVCFFEDSFVSESNYNLLLLCATIVPQNLNKKDGKKT